MRELNRPLIFGKTDSLCRFGYSAPNNVSRDGKHLFVVRSKNYSFTFGSASPYKLGYFSLFRYVF